MLTYNLRNVKIMMKKYTCDKLLVMKKILLFLTVFLFTIIPSFGIEENLTFLYINGSNNNDTKMKDWYINGVNKLHPVLKEKFEENESIKKWAQENKLTIDDDPQIFFWGYDSKEDLDFVKDRLNLSKAFSSTLAYGIRSLLTQFLHDAIWVQKTHNMLPLLDSLNDRVKEQYNNGKHVILYGYSAGTFINYQYMIYKLPYIRPEKLFSALNMDEEFMTFVKENPAKNTCLSALSHDKGKIGVISGTGHLVLNQDKEQLKENYLKLDEATERYCAPEGAVKGFVNFASPIPLFYSDISDKNYEITFFNKYAIKYVLENGLYFLTVNFREDPLGFPSGRNLTIPQYEEILDLTLENPTGVIYDNSSVWSKRSALFAHTSYWSARSVFAKAVVKSFVEGTKFQYNEEYRNKVIKNQKKKSEEI